MEEIFNKHLTLQYTAISINIKIYIIRMSWLNFKRPVDASTLIFSAILEHFREFNKYSDILSG